MPPGGHPRLWRPPWTYIQRLALSLAPALNSTPHGRRLTTSTSALPWPCPNPRLACPASIRGGLVPKTCSLGTPSGAT